MTLHPSNKIFITLVILLLNTAFASSQGRRHINHRPTNPLCQENQSTQGNRIQIYDIDMVDVQPSFPGGDNALLRFINHTRRYPADAYNRGIHGRVLCSFIIMPDGSVSYISVIRGVEPSLDQEAIRIISEMPQWKAGELGGQPVPVHCILPIAFRL